MSTAVVRTPRKLMHARREAPNSARLGLVLPVECLTVSGLGERQGHNPRQNPAHRRPCHYSPVVLLALFVRHDVEQELGRARVLADITPHIV